MHRAVAVWVLIIAAETDYDIARGGFMLFGLGFMPLAPALAPRARR